jgi:hypothetical protein
MKTMWAFMITNGERDDMLLSTSKDRPDIPEGWWLKTWPFGVKRLKIEQPLQEQSK